MTSYNVTIATAPCAWGVWYAEHEKQPRAEQYLQEVSQLGIQWTELGPWGFLGTSAEEVQSKISQYKLKMCGASLAYPFALFMQGAHDFFTQALHVAHSLVASSARYLIVMDDSGYYTPKSLMQWKRDSGNYIYSVLLELQARMCDMGCTVLFHPHAATCIEREEEILKFLENTHGRIPLCFDIGHHAYCGGEPGSFLQKHADVIPYIHMKNIDTNLQKTLEQKGMSAEEIFSKGVMVDLESGCVDIPALKGVLKKIDYNGFLVFEQDTFGMPLASMMKLAQQNIDYWEGI